MIRRIATIVLFALALGGCATDPAYRGDGNYRGAYNDGYYSAPADGYGDYYYDRPQVVFDAGYYGYGGPYAGYGFGFGSPWVFGFGYDPWFRYPWYGYRYPHHWRRPWPPHPAVAVDMDRRGIQTQVLAAPIRPSGQDRASHGMGHRTDTGRNHEDRARPRP